MDKLTFFGTEEKKFINLKEASFWASQYLNRKVTISNISYLLQYGRVTKYGSIYCTPDGVQYNSLTIN